MLTPEEAAELAALEAKYGNDTGPTTGLSAGARSFAGTDAPSATQELLGGAKHALDRAAYGIKSLLPQSIQNLGDTLDRKLGLGGLNQEKYEQGKAFVKESSPLANVGEIGGDVLMSLAPGGAAIRGGQALTKALAGRAPTLGLGLGAEAAGNAAWSAATSPEDRELGALLGAGGTAAGRVLNRALSGPMAPAVTDEARRMMDKGVGLTMGQMVTGAKGGFLPETLRKLEDSATSIPFVGDVIKHRSIGAIKDWNVAEINKVLKDTGISVKSAGVEGFDQAKSALRNKFNDVIENVSINPAEARQALDDLGEGLQHLPMLNDAQRKYMEKWVNLHLGRHIQSGDLIDGRTARAIDRGIDEEITKWQTKGSAWDQSLVDAFEQVQGAWRSAFRHAEGRPEAVNELQALIRAQDELGLLQKASNKSVSGVFSPIQLQRTYERVNRPFSQTLKDAKQVLPDKVPSTGSAERAILYHMATPGGVAATATGASAFTGLGPLLGTAAAFGGAYTKPGVKYLASGVKPVLDKLGAKLSREEMEYVIKLLSQQGSTAALSEFNQSE